MKNLSLSEEIEKMQKKDYSITAREVKEKKKTITNLPQVRKVALAKRRAKGVLIGAFIVSWFSLSVFIGFIFPFLLFQ